MFRKIKKVFCCSMILSLVVSSLAFAASLPNYYGKNYTYTKSKTIAKMEAEGNGNTASTTVTNIAKSKRYYSAYVNRRYADSNRVIENQQRKQLLLQETKYQLQLQDIAARKIANIIIKPCHGTVLCSQAVTAILLFWLTRLITR